jgi:uncharacterized protein YukE
MANYSFIPQVGDDGVQAIRTITEKLRVSLEELTAAAGRFKAMNSGLAIDNYDQAQILWNQGMTEMEAALGVKGANLNRIGEGYVNADVTGAGFFPS